MKFFARHQVFTILLLALIVGGVVFAIGQALRDPAVYAKVPSNVTAVERIETVDPSCSCPDVDYRTTIAVEGWTLTRDLSKAWPIGTNLNVYRIETDGDPRFELTEPADELDITLSNAVLALMVVGPAGIGMALGSTSGGSSYGGGSGSSFGSGGSSAAVFAATSASFAASSSC